MVVEWLKKRRKDTKFCASLRRLLGSRKFTTLMISIISINAISLAVETSYRCRLRWGTFFEVTDAFFIAVHTTELLLKPYVDPIAYQKSSYNTLDATILLIAFLPHVLPVDTATRTHLEGTTRGFQTLHILKLITYSSGMRIFTETFGQTVQTVMYALILLFLLMFVFAVLGHGWYGDPKTGDTEDWGSLKAALFTVFSLVTVDGWTDLQHKMDHYGFTSSHVFIVVFILLGNFIFFNMLIALVITKTQDLTQKCEQDCKAAKAAAVWAKKQKILKMQGKNVSSQVTLEQVGCGQPWVDSTVCKCQMLFNRHKITQGEDFSELLGDIKKTLRHSDIIIMEGFCFTIPFIDLYLLFLDLQDDTLNRLQHHCYEHTGILRETVEVMKEKSLPDHEKVKS
ncbi:cation channel sperm-associated protein 3 [Gymnogyps californianus]|uniref:cation channel sperm-associated protein 3 n=1 Tax=Gymnogyps californianus TaxID=33616 RepID=UPI0021C58F4A|nr:cation channel sperm-associated protein 3 [Gymnogyps californianus]